MLGTGYFGEFGADSIYCVIALHAYIVGALLDADPCSVRPTAVQ